MPRAYTCLSQGRHTPARHLPVLLSRGREVVYGTNLSVTTLHKDTCQDVETHAAPSKQTRQANPDGTCALSPTDARKPGSRTQLQAHTAAQGCGEPVSPDTDAVPAGAAGHGGRTPGCKPWVQRGVCCAARHCGWHQVMAMAVALGPFAVWTRGIQQAHSI